MSRRCSIFLLRIAVSIITGGLCNAPAQDAQPPGTAGLTLYSIGDPSGDETEILELINRARANPTAEGQRIAQELVLGSFASEADYQTYYNEILTDFPTFQVHPPLAFNPLLNQSAAAHVADMMTTGIVQHPSSDGTSPQARVTSFGYAAYDGENASGSSLGDDVIYTPLVIHDVYQIDYQVPSRGHRLNIMEPGGYSHTEAGISAHVVGFWSTEDFGARGTPPLLTGAVFADNLGTGFYASGEGVSGMTVTAPGFSTYYAVTGVSGAYTLPLDLTGPVYTLGAPYTYDLSTGQFTYSPFNAAPVVNVTFTDHHGNTATQPVTLTHTETVFPSAADPTTGFTGTEPAYSDGNGVPRWDNAEADLVEPATGNYSLAPLRLAFFAGEMEVGNGVRYLAFPNGNYFGYYSALLESNYIYHFDLGYEYVFDARDGKNGVYLYDFKSNGFIYTSPTFPFPYLYDFNLNSVVYYYPDPSNVGHYNTNGVRYFYVFNTGQIVEK